MTVFFISENDTEYLVICAALLEIRDSRLYKDGYSTFEEYCRDRWGMARNYANKMIAASEVVTNLGTTVPIPTSERQARPLVGLAPEEQKTVWLQAVETAPNGKITVYAIPYKTIQLSQFPKMPVGWLTLIFSEKRYPKTSVKTIAKKAYFYSVFYFGNHSKFYCVPKFENTPIFIVYFRCE